MSLNAPSEMAHAEHLEHKHRGSEVNQVGSEINDVLRNLLAELTQTVEENMDLPTASQKKVLPNMVPWDKKNPYMAELARLAEMIEEPDANGDSIALVVRLATEMIKKIGNEALAFRLNMQIAACQALYVRAAISAQIREGVLDVMGPALD